MDTGEKISVAVIFLILAGMVTVCVTAWLRQP
jgi:hypothetical protein